MEFFNSAIRTLGGIVWGPQTAVLLLGVGLYLSLRLRFIQMRKLGLSVRLALGRSKERGDRARMQGDISPFQALSTALAGAIGNGNIGGVATAIAMGGPGAIFWMWLSALLGMATRLVEAVLGQKFRRLMPDGSTAGGPMFYISEGLKLPWLAAAYALFMGAKPLFSTTTVQSNSIALALEAQFGVTPWISGLSLAFLTWLVIIGGIKTIARVTEWLSPFMVVVYILGAFVTIILFASRIPEAFRLIFVGAFHPSSFAGGVAGATVARAIRYGLSRGAYSNEAGSGTAAVFHASARTAQPVRQGLIASVDVFIDTLVICTLTALAVLVSGAWTNGSTSTEMVVGAFNASIPGVGGWVVVLSSLLFGYSSLIANPYYAEIAFSFVFGVRVKKPFRWLFCLFIFVGAVLEVEVAWSIGDVLNGMMVFINLIGVLALSGLAAGAVKTYLKEEKQPGSRF
jgi:AGCS family alanine or glycine:cation symporter